MHYQAMIVDDEYLARQLILQSIDWERLGIDVICEAGDGQEALDLYQKYRPDIILADINMPIMDGLELARSIRARNETVEIIILSTYDEFQFARQAIELNATSYLLKPIQSTEITQALEMSLRRLKTHRAQSSLLKEAFLQRLVTGRVSQIEYDQKIEEYGLLFLNEPFQMIISDTTAQEPCFSSFFPAMSDGFVFFEYYAGGIVGLIAANRIAFVLQHIPQTGFQQSTMHTGMNGVLNAFSQITSPVKQHLPIQKDTYLEKIPVFIEAHLADNALSLKTIAKEFFINDTYLSRSFKKHFHKSIVDYIAEKRIELAKEILQQPHIKMYEVAFLTGFRDAQYFSKCFKKYTGTNVNTYRKNIQIGG